MAKMADQKIKEWMQEVARNEDLINFNIQIDGETHKSDGYLSKVTFVTITGKARESDQSKILNFAVKWSQKSTKLRKHIPMQQLFSNEIFIYHRVKPAFEVFEKGKTDEDLLDFFVRCYDYNLGEKNEILILENLKLQEYVILDRKQPILFDHLKLILEAYGRLHAVSLAMKQEEPKKFEELVKNNIKNFSFFATETPFINFLPQLFETALNSVSPNEQEILEKVRLLCTDLRRIVVDMFSEDTEDQVILHGNGWTNNFLFKLEKSTNNPLGVRLIDWQFSGLGNPIMDISYLLYCCSETEIYEDVNIFLKIYHESLSKNLTKLGLEMDKIFCYEKLLKYWKKYSSYGLILASFILKISLCEPEDAPDYAELLERGKKIQEIFSFDVKNEDEYFKRMKNNFIHYVKNL